MAGGAVAAAGRDPGLQVRSGGMAKAAITIMRHAHRGICGRTRIVTIRTRAGESHISGGHMVDTAVGRRPGRVTIQTVGRIGSRSDGVDDLLSRAVMTGGAGSGPVGGNIMFGAFDLSPGRHHMTAAARASA